jgi:hypothetical protein
MNQDDKGYGIIVG